MFFPRVISSFPSKFLIINSNIYQFFKAEFGVKSIIYLYMNTQINIHLQWEEARSSMLSQHIDFGEVDLESEGGHTNRKEWKSDVCQSAVFEGIQKESKEAMKGTMGGLWASTLLLHQCALRVQTDGVLGSLCWCTVTPPLPFLLLLLITKTFVSITTTSEWAYSSYISCSPGFS